MLTRNKNHIYRDGNGKILISVTQHLNISGLQDFSMIRPEVLAHAATKGQHIHQAHYLYLLDDLCVDSLDPAYKGYCEAFIKFYKEQNIEVWDSENIISCKRLMTAGSFDLICSFNSVGSVIEFKTCATMPETTRLQTAGYKILWNGNKSNNLVINRYGVHLLKTGKYMIYRYEDRSDEQAFKNMVNFNWWVLSNFKNPPIGAKNSDSVYALCQSIIKGG